MVATWDCKSMSRDHALLHSPHTVAQACLNTFTTASTSHFAATTDEFITHISDLWKCRPFWRPRLVITLPAPFRREWKNRLSQETLTPYKATFQDCALCVAATSRVGGMLSRVLDFLAKSCCLALVTLVRILVRLYNSANTLHTSQAVFFPWPRKKETVSVGISWCTRQRSCSRP